MDLVVRVSSQEQRAVVAPRMNQMSNVVFVSLSVFPGHALHEKSLQRQIGVGTLVNSQQRRALAVPVINRG